MSLTPARVKETAHLARLSISDNEMESLTHDLDNILNLVNKMSEVDISQVEPLAHPLDANQPLRVDAVSEQVNRDALMKNAPQSMMGLYIVPQVLESEG